MRHGRLDGAGCLKQLVVYKLTPCNSKSTSSLYASFRCKECEGTAFRVDVELYLVCLRPVLQLSCLAPATRRYLIHCSGRAFVCAAASDLFLCEGNRLSADQAVESVQFIGLARS